MPGNVELRQALDEPLGDARPRRRRRRAHDHAELLAAEPADDVVRPNAGAKRVGERAEKLVADTVPVHVVDALEVVDVEHEHRDRLVRAARFLQRGQQPLVEAAVVEEAGERVRLRLMLEPRANLGVVERERSGIGEPPREVELVGGEDSVLADPVDVQHALDPRARDQRNRDERLGVVRRAGDEAHARIEVRLVHVRGLASPRGPAGDSFVEADLRRHDLVRVLVAGEHGGQDALRLVRLVDRERVVRDQVAERVCDTHEQRVEALLGEHLVEDVGEPLVRLDELRRRRARELSGMQPEMRGSAAQPSGRRIAALPRSDVPRLREPPRHGRK